MFFCKDMFRKVPKALSVKEIKDIPNKYNILETGSLPYLRLVLFLSAPVLRLTPHESFPGLVPALPG